MQHKLLATAFAGALLASASALAIPLSGVGGAENAILGGTVIDFDTAPAGRFANATVSGVTLTAGAGTVFEIGSDFAGSFNTRGSQSVYNDRLGDSFKSIEINFGSAVNAFAFNWGAADEQWTLTAFDAANAVIESTVISPTGFSNAGEYVGISASGIVRVTVTQNAACSLDCPIDFVFIDNLTFGGRGTTDVPAPAGLALLGASVIGLALSRRR